MVNVAHMRRGYAGARVLVTQITKQTRALECAGIYKNVVVVAIFSIDTNMQNAGIVPDLKVQA